MYPGPANEFAFDGSIVDYLKKGARKTSDMTFWVV